MLGPTVPLLNPLRVAEEFAMLDNIANGRVIVGLMRGTAFEYNTYSINPAESRDRFEEALQLIVAAWTETQPFGWQGRFYRYRTISLWPKPVPTAVPAHFHVGLEPPVQLDENTTRAIRASGYFGADVKTQETRADRPLSVRERVDAGYLFCGSPETVFQQLCQAKEKIGAGILELGFPSNKVPHE